jgi:hypothetical protein
MKHSIWIAPWDLAGREPADVIAILRGLGLDSCNLALSYHGGRMLLPMNRCQTVYEQHPGALYFPADLARYSAPLCPAIGAEAELALAFLEECRRESFPVWGWTVLCHNDYLGPLAPECCVQNAFGERYTYALCPSHPEVQRFAATLCADIASLVGVTGLDLEAVGFLGYDHASLHGKSGIALSSDVLRLLSICFCPHCRERMGPHAEKIAATARNGIRAYLHGSSPEPLPHVECLMAARHSAQIAMLRSIREACGSAVLNLRLATDSWFFGGKSTLGWDDLAGLVDAATVTFFGQPVNAACIPEKRPVALHTGFVFHGPDCTSAADVSDRYRLLCACAPEQITFYSFSLAAGVHFEWLHRALQGDA